MKLKSYKKRHMGTYVFREIIIIFIGLMMAIWIINYYYRGFNKTFMAVASVKTKSYISRMINEATDDIKFDTSLFVIDRNINNEIKMVSYDSYEATKLTNQITSNIQKMLDNNEDIIIGEIPVGVVFKNNLLRNMGPRIKIKIEILGNAITELNTEVKPYGINNALIQVNVKIIANARVVLPLDSEEVEIENIVPISINIINGKVPEAYMGRLS